MKEILYANNELDRKGNYIVEITRTRSYIQGWPQEIGKLQESGPISKVGPKVMCNLVKNSLET